MRQTVLAYQFIAGLKPEICLKVARHERSFEQQLMKARLDEAKLRDLQPTPENVRLLTEKALQGRPQLKGPNADNRDHQCFVCGQGGHLKRQCPQLRRGKPVEAQGATGRNNSNRTTTNHLTGQDQEEEFNKAQLKVEQSRKKLQSAKIPGDQNSDYACFKANRGSTETCVGWDLQSQLKFYWRDKW